MYLVGHHPVNDQMTPEKVESFNIQDLFAYFLSADGGSQQEVYKHVRNVDFLIHYIQY